MDGPWWWSSGQHTRLILRRSEFQSHWSLIFSANLFLERTKINKKRPGLAHFLKKQCSWIQVIEFSYLRLYIHHYKANVSQSVSQTRDHQSPTSYVRGRIADVWSPAWLDCILPNKKICCNLFAVKPLNTNLSNWRPFVQVILSPTFSVLQVLHYIIQGAL